MAIQGDPWLIYNTITKRVIKRYKTWNGVKKGLRTMKFKDSFAASNYAIATSDWYQDKIQPEIK